MTKQLHLLILFFSALAILGLGILFPVNFTGIAQESKNSIELEIGAGRSASLPADLMTALATAYGNFEDISSLEDFLRDLQAADIVLIGEAHYDRRDMQTAFEIVRLLAQRRRVALAVERFPVTLQPRLDSLNSMDSEELREVEMRSILRTDDYQTVWGMSSDDRSKFPNPFEPSYPRNSPSADVFEGIVLWAARARIPMLGLDLPLSERASGLGEDIPYRNELWKNQIVQFLEKNQSANYLVVAIGGIDHFSNAPDSVQEKLRNNLSTLHILSIGQRDTNYPSESSKQVDNLALKYHIKDLILRNPQFAVVLQNGVTIFPSPPDYWIAVQSSDIWGN